MENDPWKILRKYTHARVAMGRAGNAVPTEELLKFKMDHAQAQDAIHSSLDMDGLNASFQAMGLQTHRVHSQVLDITDYLRNPVKGKILNDQSILHLQALTNERSDVCIIVTDGLSANAVNLNAVKIVERLIPLLAGWILSPIIIAKYGRVALSDPIGESLQANIALILIGERPGLSSQTSMGAYLTYRPQTGNTDEKRNCVSNIQPEGLSYELAAGKISYLLHQMRAKQLSGVQLKDDGIDVYPNIE